MNKKDPFVTAPLALMEIPGFPPRLILAYSRLVLHAGENGRCYPKHQTLAREIGMKSRRQIVNLLHELRE